MVHGGDHASAGESAAGIDIRVSAGCHLSGTCMLRSPFHPCPHNPQGCCGKSVMSGLASAPFLKFRMASVKRSPYITGR